jgi:hypothetical protein
MAGYDRLTLFRAKRSSLHRPRHRSSWHRCFHALRAAGAFDAHHAGLEGFRERGLVAGIEGALRGLGFERLLDPAHDGGAGGEPFAPDLAARKLAGFEQIVDGIARDHEQLRNGLDVKNVRLLRRASAGVPFQCVFHGRRVSFRS